MSFKEVNVNVGGPKKDAPYTYKEVILKPNKSFAEQVTDTDRIYVIKWDFDLDGEEITIPENCVLKFEGGSLSNGTIIGQNTVVLGYNKCLVAISVEGTYSNTQVYSDWVYYDEANDIKKLQNGLNLCKGAIYSCFNIVDGDYNIECKGIDADKHYTDGGLKIPGNTKFDLGNNSLFCIPNDGEGYAMLSITEDDVTISNGHLIGDVETHIGESGEWGYGIQIIGAQNIIIKDINSSYFWGDGIIITAKINGEGADADLKLCQNITIERCSCSHNRRQGISVLSCIGLNIYNSKFINTGNPKGADPRAGIDFEQNWYNKEIIDDVFIEGCVFTGNGKGICINDKMPMEISRTFNIYVTNSSFGNTCQFRAKEDSNIIFDNCTFNGWIQFTDGNISFNYCKFYGHFHLLPPNGDIVRESNYIFNNCDLAIKTVYSDTAFIHVWDGVIGKEKFLFKNTNFSSELNRNEIQKIVDGNSLNNIYINYIGCNFFEPYFDSMAVKFAWHILFTEYIINCSGFSIGSIIVNSNNNSVKRILNNNFNFHRYNSIRDIPYFIINGDYRTPQTRDILIINNKILLDSVSTPLWNDAKTDNNLDTKPKVSVNNNYSNIFNDKTRQEYTYIQYVAADQLNDTLPLQIRSDIKGNSDGYKGAIGINISKNKLLFHNGNSWVDCNGRSPENNSGTTAKRPELNSDDISHPYFDTTLGKPIWWNGTAWVDATGAAV